MERQLDLLASLEGRVPVLPGTREDGKPARSPGHQHPDRDSSSGRGLARSTDAAPSHEAAARYAESGQLAGDRLRVLEALRRHRGATSKELAAAADLDYHLVAKRLPDLERLGLVRAMTHKPDPHHPNRAVDSNLRPCAERLVPCLRWWVR